MQFRIKVADYTYRIKLLNTADGYFSIPQCKKWNEITWKTIIYQDEHLRDIRSTGKSDDAYGLINLHNIPSFKIKNKFIDLRWRLKLVADNYYIHYIDVPKEYFANCSEIEIKGLYTGTITELMDG